MEMDMRTLRLIPVAVAGLLLAGAAACTNAPAPGPSATPTPTATTPPCPVGSWHSTGVAATATAGGLTLALSGGSGVKVTVGADGKVNADFSNMQPAIFSTQVGTTPVQGEITYAGTTSGMLDLSATAAPTGSATPTGSGTPTATPATSASVASTPSPTGSASGKSGAWSPTGSADVSQLSVTVKLTAPIATTLVNNVKVSSVSGSQNSQTGNALDLQPLLRTGTYQCNGESTLTVTTAGNGPTLVWTLARD
jgi:hypothetical protein